MSIAAVEVHEQANEQLRNQTEQLSRINDDLVEMDDDIKRGKKFPCFFAFIFTLTFYLASFCLGLLRNCSDVSGQINA